MQYPNFVLLNWKFLAVVLSRNMTQKRSFKSRHDLKKKLESTTFKTHLIFKLSNVEVDFLAEGASDVVEVLPWKYNLETGGKTIYH